MDWRTSLRAFTLLLTLLFVCSGRASAAQGIDFSWRAHKGDFPQDKPGYLILTTEDAVHWSRMLPEFVKQKEHMGFHVYVATERDYGTGQTGNAQANVVRAWMREFNKRAKLKYALLIGDGSSASSNLPSPTIPDGEHYGLEAAYADLNGRWVDLWLDSKEVDTRSAWEQECAGSIIGSKAMREGGPRHDDVILGRISYAGNEIGNSAYDLDRIFEKTIRYERETETGRNLDWRAHVHSVITNYGGTNWDDPLIHSVEKEGATIEWRSDLGISGPYVPENNFDGKPANEQLLQQTRRRGMLCCMSHGWNRGGEGTVLQQQLFTDMDDRFPSSVGFASCTAFALGDNCNMGQAWLRKGAIFACGTAMSANNNSRVPLQVGQLEKRLSVGEAGGNGVVQYGDPSLHVVPSQGIPLCELQVEPAYAAHYEERTQEAGRLEKPIAQTYTLTNHSKKPMDIFVECDASWVSLSTMRFVLKPGESTHVDAKSCDLLEKLTPGIHIADIRFVRGDGQRDERRIAVKLAPVSLEMAYSFDEAVQGNHFPDVSVTTQPDAWHDHSSLWLVEKTTGPHWNPFVKLGNQIPGYSVEVHGKVGGALRLEHPAAPFSRGIAQNMQWRGASASFWFKVDALPAAGKTTTVLTAPFALLMNSDGALTFAQGGKPVSLEKVATGEWHFVQLRSDIEGQKVRASLDGKPEVIGAAGAPPAKALTLGSFDGAVDEIKVWSGELSDAAQAAEFHAADKSFAPPAAAPAAVYADDGVLRAPKDLPSVFNLSDAKAKLDVSKILADAHLVCLGLREAPQWLDFKNGVFSLNAAVDFDRLDFGGYDLLLVLKARDGRVCEHPLKVRLPVPAVNIRIVRAVDDSISFVNAGDRYGKPDRPLAKGVIRYTIDGSAVTENSSVYFKPFKMSGKKITARFFYLGAYPMAPVTMDAQFGIPHDLWRATAVSGNPNTGKSAGNAMDGHQETVWQNEGGTLPQFLSWTLGKEETLSGISVQSTIKNADGRIKSYVVYASEDNTHWRKVKEGELQSTPNPVKITFDEAVKAKFLKFEATSLHAGTDMVVSELEAFSR